MSMHRRRLAAALLALPLTLSSGCREAADPAGAGFNRGAEGTMEPPGQKSGAMPAGSVPVGDPHALESHPDAAGK